MYICCKQRGSPGCMTHHGEEIEVFKHIEDMLNHRGYVTRKDADYCYGAFCMTLNEARWSFKKLIECNVLTETYDSLGLPEEEKKYIYLFKEIVDHNYGRI